MTLSTIVRKVRVGISAPIPMLRRLVSGTEPLNMHRAWQVLLVLFIVANALSLAANLWFFEVNRDMENQLETSGDTASGIVTIDRSELSGSIDRFSRRAFEFERLRKNPNRIVDPSR